MDTLNEYVKFYEAVVKKSASGTSKPAKKDPWIPPKKSDAQKPAKKSDPWIPPKKSADWKTMSTEDKMAKIKETIAYFKSYDNKRFKKLPKFKTEDEAAIYFEKLIFEYVDKYNELVHRLIKDYDLLFDKEGKKLKGVYERAYGWAYDASSWLKGAFKNCTEEFVHWNDNGVTIPAAISMMRFYDKLPKNQQSKKVSDVVSHLDSIEYSVRFDTRNFREAGRRTIFL